VHLLSFACMHACMHARVGVKSSVASQCRHLLPCAPLYPVASAFYSACEGLQTEAAVDDMLAGPALQPGLDCRWLPW
jgi:hypothetical protein